LITGIFLNLDWCLDQLADAGAGGQATAQNAQVAETNGR